MSRLDWLTARPVAHRGLHDAAGGVIENSISAFAAAVEGRYAIECDLQLSADGEAMVFHDDNLDRLTTRQGPLAALSAAELKTVPFKATADRMLTLGELCALVAGRVTLVLELKSRFDGNPALPARVAAVLRGYAGPIAAMSFDPRMMVTLRGLMPGLVRGIVGQSHWSKGEPEAAGAHIGAALRARPHFLAWSVRDLPAALPLTARYGLGMPLLTWTVRSEADRLRAGRFADQMIFEGFRP
jgi:glycerophosphoryl diester phosphodiesterase